MENDMWGNGSDGHYTHGTQISRVSANTPRWLERVMGWLPCGPCRDADAVAYEFGQSIYTPRDTSRSSLIADDRPYAGWLYLGARLSSDAQTRRGTRTDEIGLTLGVIGPAALADRTQAFIHDRRKLSMPRGWENQLKNEPGFVIDYRRSWHRGARRQRGFGFDATPYIVGALGNVHSYFGGGVTFRAGLNLSTREVARSRGGWHVFVAMEGRGVGRNVFLDGNTWVESHSVEKRPVVAELQAGMSFALGKLEIRLARTVRSEEFVGQLEPDRHGSVSFAYRP